MFKIISHEENANQNHHETPCPSARLVPKREKMTNVAEDVEKLGPAGGNVNGTTLWKNWVVPQNVKHRITI